MLAKFAKNFVFGSLFLSLCLIPGKSRMIVEMLKPSSLPWTRLEVATLAGFHNISTQPTFGKSLKLSHNFKSKMSRGARAPSVGSIDSRGAGTGQLQVLLK